MPQCKFSLYLKKAGLASRNIVHFEKKVILRCIGLCFHYLHDCPRGQESLRWIKGNRCPSHLVEALHRPQHPSLRGVCKPGTPRNTPGTSHNTSGHPRNSQEHPQNTKNSGQRSDCSRNDKAEDLRRFPTLHYIHKTFADHPEISEHFKNAAEYFRSFKEQRNNHYLMKKKTYYTHDLHISDMKMWQLNY